jgi:hypothetical protein
MGSNKFSKSRKLGTNFDKFSMNFQIMEINYELITNYERFTY